MASVRFKFRSAATFDSVDIGEQSSISLRDLKAKIVLKKHLNLCQDFDLVFSDSISGQEYKDENVRIPSGSSVIIKRVPANSSPSQRAPDTSARSFRDAECVNVIDHPAMDTNFYDRRKLLWDANGKKDNVVLRCSQEVLLRCQNVEGAPSGQSTPKDSSANEGSTLVMPKPKFKEHAVLERTSPAKHLSVENSDMPSELKCSLCRTFFKEAVMIPCCQHSFCAKCIRVALSEHASCPRCSSTKCKPEDLLPNVSLRQAIERFLESQLLLNGSENDLHRDAPDGESGIQVKEISYATIVPQRQLQLNKSATWNRSNHIMQNKLHDHTHFTYKRDPETLEDISENQGENEPQNMAGINEGSCSDKVEGSRVITSGGERNFTAPGRPNRGPRTCYMCGSPDHLIRDCPCAANSTTSHWNGVASLPTAVSGYPPPYWPGNTPHQGPFVNMYGGPGMMFYNTNTAPISPFAFSSCPPAVYGGYPVVRNSGFMNVGGMTLPAGSIAQQPRQLDFLELQKRAQLQRNYDVDLARTQISEKDQNAKIDNDYAERGPYYSGDGFGRRSEGKHRSHENSDGDTFSNCNRLGKSAHYMEHGRDLRTAQSDRSSSEKDVPDSRIRPREDRHEKLYRTVRRNNEKEAQRGHDSIQKHYPLNNESSKRKRTEHDDRKSDKHSHSRSRSSLEPSYSGDGSRRRREESSYRSRHSNKATNFNGKELHHDRGKLKYSDEYREDCQSPKRKRYY